MRTRWLIRIMLAGAMGWSMPAVSSAQTSPPIPFPPPAANAPAGIPTVVIHTNVPDPPAALDANRGGPALPQVASPDVFPEAPPSGRFHILPQAWRDAIRRRFGRGPTATPDQFLETPSPIQINPQPTPQAELPGVPGSLIPVSSPPPQGFVPDPPTAPGVDQGGPSFRDTLPEEPMQSGRFHILPQSWREAISSRFGGGSSVVPDSGSGWPTPDGANAPTPQAELTGVVPVSSPPQSQTPLPQPELVPPPTSNAPQAVATVGPQPNETWASPPEPPITSQVPLPYRDPGMAWRKMPTSAPSDLPPPPQPPYPARFHILPEGARNTLGHCLNGCGMACYADRDTPGCGSFRQEFLFIFGSCHYFFGEACYPDYLGQSTHGEGH